VSCPAVIDVLVPSGPVVVDVVTPGPQGPIGSRWLTGTAVPASSLGLAGDFYLRSNGDVYGPKTSNWGSVQFTLTGTGGASLSDSTPEPLGTPSAGTALVGSKGDHRHAMPTAAQVGADAAGTAAAAIAAHAAAADPHPTYATAAEAAAAAPVQSVAGRTGAVTLAPADVTGLGTAATTDATAYATAAQGAKADTAVQPTGLTSALAAKADLVGGQVPSAQLPGFVDDVLEFVNVAAFPATGEAGKLYVSLATNRNYRWSGSVYVEINPSPGSTDAVPEGSVNLYFTTARGEAAAASWWAGSASKAKLDSITGTNTGDQDLSGLLVKASNLSDLVNPSTARSNLSAAGSGAIGASGLTQSAGILGAASAGAPQVYTPIGLAFNGTNLATLADLVIPLSDETTALTASSTVAKVTIPYWPHATTLTSLPIWAVATAPTGAALQFDIRVGGTSIYLPASGGTYPTIAAGSTNSTASAGAFTTAFASAPTIAVGSSVTLFVRQIGSLVAGAGLKVIAQTRREG
jgi:hypothetical protein